MGLGAVRSRRRKAPMATIPITRAHSGTRSETVTPAASETAVRRQVEPSASHATPGRSRSVECGFLVIVIFEDENEHTDKTGGKVHPENHGPTEDGAEERGEIRREGGGADEKCAEDWAGEGGGSPNRGEDTLDFGAFFQSKDIAEDGEDDGHDAACPKSLNAPENDQLKHRVGPGGEERADCKESDGEEKDALSAEEIGESSEEGHGDGGGEEVDGGDPGVVFETFEGADDGGHGGGGDGGLHGGEDHDHEESRGDPAPGTRGDGVGLIHEG